MAFELKRDWPIVAAVGVGGLALFSLVGVGSAGGSSAIFPSGSPTGSGSGSTSGANAQTAASLVPAIVQYETDLAQIQASELQASQQNADALFAYLKPNPPPQPLPAPPKPDVFGEILATISSIYAGKG